MIVGVDIGGTKTHIRSRAASGAQRDLVVPSTDWRNGGLFDDPDNASRLNNLVHELVSDAEVSDAARLVVGAHGCDTAEACEAFAADLGSLRAGPVTVVNDAALLVAATGNDAGLAVIAGTGSIVVAVFAGRPPFAIGGFGWLLGDAASAPGLVRESVKHVLARRDEGLSREILGERLIAHFGVPDETELIYRLGDAPVITDWASAAPLVFGAADAGSALASGVINAAAAELATDVERAVARGADASVVVCAGGVITHQPRLFRAFCDEVAQRVPQANVQLFDEPPVAGAIALGLREEASAPLATDVS
ncbi:N-acetylglucosamine kinase [Microbacterium sp. YY-01]|uniref:N-acetylglucosamine kinase n=1 Tax=Microbacterium sp. YY-01 TaxID=3421634 RepID=UPI003D16A46E